MMCSVKKLMFLTLCCIAGSFIFATPSFAQTQKRQRAGALKVVQLPTPNVLGSVTLEEAISRRRSVRQFADKPLNFAQMGQLAWAGQGVTDEKRGFRAAPSAGALYPIELYFVTPDGLFVYRPQGHSLEQISSSDLRNKLSAAAMGQEWVAKAPCSIIIAGSVRKVAAKYGNKATRFMLLEAGHVAENIQLQAVALGLASVPVGAFDIKNVEKVCELPGILEPLLIVSVGYSAEEQQSQGETQSADGTSAAKKAVLVVPGVNFRDEELFETRRILNEAGIESVIASSKIAPLQGMLGGVAASEITLDKVQVEDFDAVVFIGGMGAADFFNNSAVLGIARDAVGKHKVVAAISIAPAILANAGVLKGVRATGFIAIREQMQKSGAKYTGAGVERDGLIITGSDFSVVVPFAREIAAAIQQEQPKPNKRRG